MSLCVQVSKNTQDPEWNYEAQVTLPDQGDKTITIEVRYGLILWTRFIVSYELILGSEERRRCGSVKPNLAVRSFVHAANERSVILML
jgi:hypothetical protein